MADEFEGDRVRSKIACISLVVVLALSVGGIGCTGEYGPQTTEYSLIISSTEGGTTVPELDCLCAEGTETSLEAIPDPGYSFIGWTGDVDTIADVNAAKTTIIVNDNYTITANFYEISATYYTLTLVVSGNGSTSPSVGQHTYAGGTVVPITAFPADGYRFVIWTGSVGTVANVIAATTTITVNADYSIKANFEGGTVTLPSSDVGTTVRGAIGEEGYFFPSDLQRHSFFTGAT